MLSEKNVFLDSLCLFILVFLVKHNAKEQYIKHASRTTLAKHVARKQIKQIKTGVSKALIGAKNKVSKKLQDASNAKNISFSEQADLLLQQLTTAQTTADQSDLLNDKEKTVLALDIKTLRSHIEHIKKESIKEPQEFGLLSGSTLEMARVVHKRSVEKKLLLTTNKTGTVLLTLHNELLGQDQKISPATSVLQGLERNQTLLV
jgi:hypothetical protein